MGNNLSTGVIRISGSIKLGYKTGNWTFLQLTNSAGEEVVGFRTGGSSGPWSYRLNGGDLGSTTIANETENYHSFEIIIDFTLGTVTVKVDGTTLTSGGDNGELYPTGDGVKALNISNIAFANINAGRSVFLKSIVVEEQV